jgi:hypothetical protein
MRIRHRLCVGAVSALASAFLMAGPASASPNHAQSSTASCATLCMQFGGSTREECIVTQSNFARYYKITVRCGSDGVGGWWFFYEPRR